MDLVAVSRRFDMTPLWDAYTGEKLSATCQVTVWDNPRRDGLTSWLSWGRYLEPANC